MNSRRTLGVASLCLALGIGVGCKAPAQTVARAGDVSEARGGLGIRSGDELAVERAHV